MKTLTLIIQNKSDNIGALASTLCMIHCFVTPFFLIIQNDSIKHSEAMPFWWKWIDLFFICISLLAVYHSANKTSNTLVKNTLWISWIALFLTIINEKTALIHLPEIITYIVASLLILIHLYNHKYCQCNKTKPSTNEG